MKPYYQSERVTLYHGDCLAILPTLEAGSVDAVVTDPPYSSGGFNEMGKGGGSIGTTSKLKRIEGDTMSTNGYFSLMRRVLRSSEAVACYVFTDWRMWPHTTESVELSGFRVRGMLVWNKGWGGMGARWKSQHELICWGTKVVSRMGAGHGNVITTSRSGNANHPTEKPIDLVETIVKNAERSGADGSSIIDPFMGSGTTGVACVKTGRRFIGIEIDEKYCEIAAKRIQAAEREQSERLVPA